MYITDFYMFLASVLLISLSGVLMPGPLFAATIQKAAKSKISGALIAVGHGIIEFPLMFAIFFLLSEFQVPVTVQVAVGLVGGALMVFMGAQTYRSRHTVQDAAVSPKRDSVLAGAYTTAANAGFILWWLTIGTTLIFNAKIFGLLGFSIFAGVHWFVDFAWYTAAAFLIFKSQRFWNERVRMGITLFCVAVFVGFGLFFMASALWTLLA
ncbi:MAG: LysE family translocator [Candidatus Bathyarchaeota archaeon]|nr:LysE family translocator [Candidatus Bathyarchaeota archaeon]